MSNKPIPCYGVGKSVVHDENTNELSREVLAQWAEDFLQKRDWVYDSMGCPPRCSELVHTIRNELMEMCGHCDQIHILLNQLDREKREWERHQKLARECGNDDV